MEQMEHVAAEVIAHRFGSWGWCGLTKQETK
jgi:hypothetical protein